MRIHYYKASGGNFGDDLNPWLWPKLLGDLLEVNPQSLLVGIGTLLSDELPPAPRKVVFGAGAGYGPAPKIDGTYSLYCVRGPRTAARLGLDVELAVTDPAVLVQLHFRFSPQPGGHPVALVPHHESMARAAVLDIDLRAACEDVGIQFVDPRQDVESVLSQLASSQLVLAEAMHAAIVSDALRVPWAPLTLFDHVLPFKWLDWSTSVELEHEPLDLKLTAETATTAGARKALFAALRLVRPRLSGAGVLARKTEELESRLDQLRRDLIDGRIPEGGPLPPVAAVDPEASSWFARQDLACLQLRSVLVPGDVVVVIHDGQLNVCLPRDVQRRALLSNNGEDAGPPGTDVQAKAAWSEARRHGASLLALAWPSFWWKDSYPGLFRQLRSEARLVLENDNWLIYRTGDGPET